MIFSRISFTMTFLLVVFMTSQANAIEESDPLEWVNRKIYAFNKITDSLYIKPATTVYEKVLPYTLRISVTNFINNMNTVPVIANDILTLKFPQAVSDIFRFGINSSLGAFGLFDVASQMGIEAHKEDLGKTFYTWGWKESSFFVIPIVGPSTIRDAIGIFFNLYASPPVYFTPAWRNRYYFLALLNRRQDLHELESIVGVAGVEYYTLVRSGYYQHREYELTDGRVVNANDNTPGHDILGEPPD